MKVVAIVQARVGSTRLPNKVMRSISGKPMIELLLARLSRSQQISEIVLATSDDPRNQPLIDLVSSLGYRSIVGSEDDVLGRFITAGRLTGAEVVVRITGDCPLIDPELVDHCVREFTTRGVDYLSNSVPPSFPDGLDTEVFRFAALETASMETNVSFDREHVTPYLRESGKFSNASVENDFDLSALRWTVDEQADFNVVANVFDHFSPDIHFSWRDVLALQVRHEHLFADNRQLTRNEGAALGTGQKLWKRAKTVIPGGNMLLSKRAEMFLPEHWPAYFSKTSGCNVWDLDGNQYVDMSIMGIGTNILGYNHPEVDAAVRRTVDAGNMSTFNCPEEVYLAEKLIELHPWADMARLARSGGEANAIAIRIAPCGFRPRQSRHMWLSWLA
jgi:glutamate-1-semialdehyde 2,1-aminomutase